MPPNETITLSKNLLFLFLIISIAASTYTSMMVEFADVIEQRNALFITDRMVDRSRCEE